MRIAMIGTGYVGLVSGACFSEFGFDVTCIDKDNTKIEQLLVGEIPIYEPGLDTLVADNVQAGRLHFTTDLASAVSASDIVFIAVGTPSRRGDGHADLTYVFAAAEELATHLKQNTLVVTKSTVPVGTGAKVRDIITKARPDLTFHVASNPEFLREGSAIEDFMRPNRIIAGIDTPEAREIIEKLYRPLRLNKTPLVFTDIATAELTKYAANAFLATKITFINEMADLCETLGANVQDVARGIGLDRRIGEKFLHAGPGYGGSCFPKDTRALARIGEEAGCPTRIVETVVNANENRKYRMAEKIIQAAGGSVEGKQIAVLGLTFKPNTDDMRESPSLVILPELLNAGANLQVYDPQGMREARQLLPEQGIQWCEGSHEALEGADLLVILTEWNAFRSLDLERISATLRDKLVVDLRNIYEPQEMLEAGLRYISVGRKEKGADASASAPTLRRVETR